jgi:predicted ArsR family transcriptional regulator
MAPHGTTRLGPTRARVLQVLQDAGTSLTSSDVAGRLGIHANSARFHLDAMAADGLVERRREDRAVPGRPRVMYDAVAAAPDVVDRRYRVLSEMLSDALRLHADDAGGVAERAGRAWGQGLVSRTRRHPSGEGTGTEERQLGSLVETLSRVGFDSHVHEDDDGLRVDIGHCPFLDVAREHQDVVCALHLGLMRGVLEGSGSDIAVAGLQPLVEPSLCHARLVR